MVNYLEIYAYLYVCVSFVEITSTCCVIPGYRVDNARLLPGMSQWGMCGNQLPKRTVWQTTNNFVTIEFRTDERTDYRRGFTMRLRQYPWRNPGNVYPDGGYFGG